jgi:hypothetical protein
MEVLQEAHDCTMPKFHFHSKILINGGFAPQQLTHYRHKMKYFLVCVNRNTFLQVFCSFFTEKYVIKMIIRKLFKVKL